MRENSSKTQGSKQTEEEKDSRQHTAFASQRAQ